VRCVLPGEIPALLDERVAPRVTIETGAGYKVSVQVNAPGAGEDRGRRKSALREIIARSLERSG
jgi:hypothetical protein